MADFLDTLITYYIADVECSIKQAGAPSELGQVSLPEPFEKFLQAVGVFLNESRSAEAELEKLLDVAVCAAMEEHDAELNTRAEESYSAVHALAPTLLGRIRDGEPLPMDSLLALNEKIRCAELGYGTSTKTEQIPKQLLEAAPSSKMYPNLVKKVAAICGRTFSDILLRETAIFKTRLLNGGCDEGLDAQKAQLARLGLQSKHELFYKHSSTLGQSDHLPLREAVTLDSESESIRMSSWNVMEFPCLGAVDPVLNGIQVSCTEMLRTLGYKCAQDRQLLLEAMSSEAVVLQHTRRVLAFIHDELEMQESEIVLLQEIGQDVQERIMEECKHMGWYYCFSTGNDDPSKCFAITGIVSKEPFDEEAQVAVPRDGKVRNFAAVRRGSLWIVSCHMPLTNAKWSAQQTFEDSNEFFAAQVLEQLWRRFGYAGDGEHKYTVAVGGDWNANLHEVLRLALASVPEDNRALSLFAPDRETCLLGYLQGMVSNPIDGIVCLRHAR